MMSRVGERVETAHHPTTQAVVVDIDIDVDAVEVEVESIQM